VISAAGAKGANATPASIPATAINFLMRSPSLVLKWVNRES